MEIYELPIVYRAPGMDAVQIRKGIPYKTNAETDLALDVYCPPDLAADTRLPGVLLVHGGPLQPELPLPKDWAAFASYGELLAASGLIGITFNYRFEASTDLATSAADIAAAIQFTYAQRAEFNLDENRLCVWLFSGGGRFLPAILQNTYDWPTCLVIYYALLDFPRQMDSEALFGQAFQRPILAVRAGYDNPVLNRSMDAFIQQARTVGANLELIDNARGHHGFDIFDDTDDSRAIIARTIVFIQESI